MVSAPWFESTILLLSVFFLPTLAASAVFLSSPSVHNTLECALGQKAFSLHRAIEESVVVSLGACKLITITSHLALCSYARFKSWP